MPAFRRILERLDEYVRGVPNRDLPAEHFDALEPDAQHELLKHVEQNPNPLFVQDDSVTVPEPAAQAEQPEPQPTPATNQPQQVVAQQPAPTPEPSDDDSGRIPPA